MGDGERPGPPRPASGAPIFSVDEVARRAAELAARRPSLEELDRLAGPEPLVRVDGLVAGYGAMEILHGVDLRAAKGQAVCLVGPTGAGKSTVLHSMYGFTRVSAGRVVVKGRDVTRLGPDDRLRSAGIAYLLQDDSVFPEMTVEENLWMGGFLLPVREAKARAERVLERYPRLQARRHERAGRLSGGERRLLEFTRALIMDPEVLLVDEPSIGLEPRAIDLVFEILSELQRREGKAILLVEQNARKGLEFADRGCVLVAGEVARVGPGAELLGDPEIGRLYLGG